MSGTRIQQQWLETTYQSPLTTAKKEAAVATPPTRAPFEANFDEQCQRIRKSWNECHIKRSRGNSPTSPEGEKQGKRKKETQKNRFQEAPEVW